MPTYRITGPDGKTYQVTAPDGATESQVLAYVQAQAAPVDPEARLAELTPGLSTNPTDGMTGPERFGAGAGKSLRDTGLGLVQALSEGGPMASGPMAAFKAMGIPMPANPVKQWADSAIAENRDADAALMDTSGGFWGNVAGTGAQVLGPGVVAGMAARTPMLAPGLQSAAANALPALLPKSLAGGAAQGSLLGFIQPVQEDESRMGNTAAGGAGGLLGGAVPRLIGAGLRATNRAIEPFREAGLENIVGRTIQRFASNPQVTPLADPILGRAPTLAEATLDPGIAQLQRAAASKSPGVANALFDSRVAANEGRASALEAFAGTPAAREAAVSKIAIDENAAYNALEGIGDVNVQPVVRQLDRILSGPSGKIPEVRASLQKARQQFFEPYEESARIKDARAIVDMAIGGRMSSADHAALKDARRLLSNRAGASADEIVEALGDIKASSKTAQAAISQAKELANSLNVAFENEVPRLVAARQAITNQLSGLGDDKGGPLAKKQLMEIRDALEAQIRKVTPNYDAALDVRRAGMKPVNEMDTVTALLQKATVPVPTRTGGMGRSLQPSAFLRPTEDLDKLARQGTGFRKAEADNVLSPQAQEAIEGVRVGLARQQFADSAGKVAGSPTAQFLAGQNIMDAVGGKPGGLLQGVMDSVAAGLDKPYMFMGVPQRLEAVMARVLSNPAEAQAILSRLPAPDKALLEQAIGRGSASLGSAGLLGTQ